MRIVMIGPASFLFDPTLLRNVVPARALRDGRAWRGRSVARRLNLHPAWLARAYLHAAGESIQATSRRHKVERALALIRSTSLSLAQIAADVGFCDQSHMIRCFHAVIGRAPSAVRSANDRLS